ncbi:hypothetical protein Q1695_012373 [Nippostrongylus brasiliensis]|nr:hypothetical protein Q1695_012373 [Nippostrongylus brasiliensis]
MFVGVYSCWQDFDFVNKKTKVIFHTKNNLQFLPEASEKGTPPMFCSTMLDQ